MEPSEKVSPLWFSLKKAVLKDGAHLKAPPQAGAVDGSHDGLGRFLNLLKHLLPFLRKPSHLLCVRTGLDHAADGR